MTAVSFSVCQMISYEQFDLEINKNLSDLNCSTHLVQASNQAVLGVLVVFGFAAVARVYQHGLT